MIDLNKLEMQALSVHMAGRRAFPFLSTSDVLDHLIPLARAGKLGAVVPLRDIQDLVYYAAGSKSAAIASAARRVQDWISANPAAATSAAAPDAPTAGILIVNDQGVEMAIERREDGKFMFAPIGPSGTRPFYRAAPATGIPAAGAVEDDARDAARYRWIEENARTSGGGQGFTIVAFVPFDEEYMGCGIDKAIAAAPHPPEAKAGAAPAHPGDGGSDANEWLSQQAASANAE